MKAKQNNVIPYYRNGVETRGEMVEVFFDDVQGQYGDLVLVKDVGYGKLLAFAEEAFPIYKSDPKFWMEETSNAHNPISYMAFRYYKIEIAGAYRIYRGDSVKQDLVCKFYNKFRKIKVPKVGTFDCTNELNACPKCKKPLALATRICKCGEVNSRLEYNAKVWELKREYDKKLADVQDEANVKLEKINENFYQERSKQPYEKWASMERQYFKDLAKAEVPDSVYTKLKAEFDAKKNEYYTEYRSKFLKAKTED